MRLVIDGRRLTVRRTGVGRYLEGLLEEWAVSGLPFRQTLVVLHDPAGRERVPQAPGLRSIVVGTGWPGLAWEWLALGRVLGPGDLLFAPGNLVPGSWSGPTVLVVHDLIQEVLPESFPWHVRWRFGGRYRRAAAKARRILVPSACTARDLGRCYDIDPGRVRIIPPGVDPRLRPLAPTAEPIAAARRALGLGGAPFFLFVGKRSRRRDIPALVAAFARHRRRHPRHRLVLAGPPEPGDPPAPCEVRPHVHLAGHVSESTLRALLAGAEALVYPSRYEGFGLPVVEAMASGCPVITSRNSALIEAGGDAAWYLDAATPEALAAAMHTLATERDARAGCVARGLAHAAQFRRARFAEAVKTELVAAAAPSGEGDATAWAPPTRARTRARGVVASGWR